MKRFDGRRPVVCAGPRGPVTAVVQPAMAALAVVLVLVAGLGACSILDPVPLPGGGHRLSKNPASAASVVNAASAVAGSASNARTASPYPTQAAATQAAHARDCADGKLATDCFAGGLGEAIGELDARRVVLVNLARDVSNGNAAYNAALYPAGAVAVFEKLRGATNRSLLAPAAVAAGLYGFVNSGVADRERHYLRAAGELHCAIVRSGTWLYLQSDIRETPPPTPYQAWSTWFYLKSDLQDAPGRWLDAAPLDAVVSSLREATLKFRSGRVKLLGELEPVAATAAASLDSIRQRAATAAGQGRGGSVGQDQRDAIAQRTRRQFESALAVLESVRALQAQVRSSGLRLRTEWVTIEQTFQSQLSEKVPLPVAPEKVATELLARTNAMAKAQGEAVSDRAGADDLDPAFPAALRNGVSAKTRPALQKFAAEQGVPLAQARDNAQAWLDDHTLRAARVDAEVRALGCKETLPPVPVRTVASSAALKPATDATPGKTTTTTTSTTTTGPANTPSSSPLPAAR